MKFKETMSPQAHARVDEEDFEIHGWPNFFKHRQRVQEAVLIV